MTVHRTVTARNNKGQIVKQFQVQGASKTEITTTLTNAIKGNVDHAKITTIVNKTGGKLL